MSFSISTLSYIWMISLSIVKAETDLVALSSPLDDPFYTDCDPKDALFFHNSCLLCLNNPIQELKDISIQCLKDPLKIAKAETSIGAIYLNQRNLRAVTIEREPFVKILKDGSYSGSCFEFFYAIQSKYNFSADIFLSEDGKWGTLEVKNGTWDGMIGQISRQEMDIGVGGFSVTLERSRVVSFTQSFHQDPVGILIPPPTEREKLTVLIRPLSYQVWIALTLTIGILSPTLYVLHRSSESRLKMPLKKESSSFDLAGQLFTFIIGSLVQEGVTSPGNKTTRYLVVIWWFLTIILANIYVAHLVSYLSAPKLENDIARFEDLVSQTKIKWTFRRNSPLQSLFKSETASGVYKAIGDGVSIEDLVQSDFEGAQRVLSGKYAFIKEKSFLEVALEEDFKVSNQCRMTFAKEQSYIVETALIVQKNSKFLRILDHEISTAVSTGLMEKWKRIHWPRELWCEDAASYMAKTRSKTRKLTPGDIAGSILLFLSGLTISLTIFIFEITLGRRKSIVTRIQYKFKNKNIVFLP